MSNTPDKEAEDRSGFTPGPWKRRVNSDFLLIVPAGTKDALDIICELGLAPAPDWMAEDRNTVNANACLIAAAPDLYEALRAIVNYEANPDFTKWKGVIERAETALAHARGEKP